MRFIKTVILLFLPAAACYATMYASALSIETEPGLTQPIGLLAFIAFYGLTLLYAGLFILLKFDRLPVLAISVILAPIAAFVYEYLNPEWLQYLQTILIAVTYTLPFLALTIAAAVFRRRRAARKAARLQAEQEQSGEGVAEAQAGNQSS